MKILWVKAGGLVPLDSGGKIRSFHIASELAKVHDVTLFIFCAEDSSEDQRTLASKFADVIVHPLKIRAGRGIGVGTVANTVSRVHHGMCIAIGPAVVAHAAVTRPRRT